MQYTYIYIFFNYNYLLFWMKTYITGFREIWYTETPESLQFSHESINVDFKHQKYGRTDLATLQLSITKKCSTSLSISR
jgi:hypothetical protein